MSQGHDALEVLTSTRYEGVATRRSTVDPALQADPVRRNRILAFLWLLGGVSGLFLNGGGDAALGMAVSVLACVIGATLFVAARRTPESLVLPLMLLSQVVVTVGGWSNRETEVVTGNLGGAYLWDCAFNDYYLPWRKASLYLAASVALYGSWVVAALPTSVGASRWCTATVALVALTLVIGRLRDELQALVGVLTRESRRDPLTAVLNRRGFSESAHRAMTSSAGSGSPLTVLALGVDHFKRLNDEHGHAAGDEALAALDALLAEHCRDQDLVGRMGGEEFAVLLPGTDLPSAMSVAERLRLAVHSLATARPMTISIGVATTTGDSGGAGASGLEDLLGAADAALYTAKRNGRDRVEVATDAVAGRAADRAPASPTGLSSVHAG